MCAARLPAGEPIARGNTSDIWPWTGHTVVKVLRPGIPAHWAALEADIIRRVHAAGLPAPATDGDIELEGRAAVVLERIDGELMWERMKRDPGSVPGLVEALVDLQTEVQATSVRGLPDLARRLGSKIDEAVELRSADRAAAQSLLAGLPAGEALCHGDFHPANIVHTAGGMVILDWFDAAVGHPTADHVRSSLLMRPSEAVGTWLSGATADLLDRVHCGYLGRLLRRGLVDAATFSPWEAVVAVARMSEPVPAGELAVLWRHWRTDGPARARAMLEDCLARSGEEGRAAGEC